MKQFKVLSRKTVAKYEKAQLDFETIQLPNGNIDEWVLMVYPDFYCAVTVKDNNVLMTKEWRQGPHAVMTQFTQSRAYHKTEEENMKELQKELKEEMGVIGGTYKNILKYAHGARLEGFTTVFLVTDFEIGETQRDENEIQEIIELPIKGLYNELLKNHIVMAETLLIAKLLEEQFT
jgi:hypothetical protein